MKLKFAAASLLAVASMSASAADQIIDLVDGYAQFTTKGVAGAVLSDDADLLTFNGAVEGGKYDVYIGITGQNLTWDLTKTTLNGVTGQWTEMAQGKVVKWIGLETTATAPFVLNLAGFAKGNAFYDGNISISAVPEPSTYGMLLGGLGIMGFLARRKSKQA